MGIHVQGNIVTIENEFMRRVIDTANGIETKSYHIRPLGEKQNDYWLPMFSFEAGIPFETAFTVDGTDYEVGPLKRIKDRHSWNKECFFIVKEILLHKGKHGEAVDFVMVRNSNNAPDLELHIKYEVCEDMPFFYKNVQIINRGTETVTVDRCCVDILRFFERKFPLSFFTNYTQCGGVNYSRGNAMKTEDDYYMSWTRIEFPNEIGLELAQGDAFTSFDLYEAATAVERQEESVILHRIYKRIAPWINRLSPTLTVNSCDTYEKLLQLADTALENGFEVISLHVGQLFTNTGDYIPRPDLFKNGYEDIKRLVDHFHQKGLKVLPYCSATIAWNESQVCKEHETWQCLGPNGLYYEPSSYGNMCYHSPWGDYIKEKLIYLLDEMNFDGLAVDGPVHGLVCEDEHHKHKNCKSVDYMNWEWEKNFYGEVASRGKILTVPETWNAILLGVTEIPGGYREEDQNELGGMPYVTMTRACVYEGRYTTPACCHWTAFNLENYHGHSIEASEENPASYEHSVAGMFGYGFDGTVYARQPYVGEKTKQIYFKWLDIFKRYRETFLGEFIHLAAPNGCDADGVLHVSPTAKTPALAVIFNPTNQPKEFCAALPLRYADIPSGSYITFENEKIMVDSASNASVKTSLAPYEVKAIPIEKA